MLPFFPKGFYRVFVCFFLFLAFSCVFRSAEFLECFPGI